MFIYVLCHAQAPIFLLCRGNIFDMYVYIYIYMHVNVHVYVCLYSCVYRSKICIFLHMFYVTRRHQSFCCVVVTFSTCMYTYIYIHVYVYMYMCIYIHVYVCTNLYINIYLMSHAGINLYTVSWKHFRHVYIYTCTCIYICMYMYIYMYVYIHVCVYIYICIFLHMFNVTRRHQSMYCVVVTFSTFQGANESWRTWICHFA